MTVFAKVEINEDSFRKAEAFLTRVPVELRTGIIPKAVGAAAVPVIQAAKQIAPDSVKSGSRGGWSNKTRASRSGVAQHKDTIGKSSPRKYQGGALVAIYVGPIVGAGGNLINIIGHPHEQVLWGKHTGNMLPGTDYLAKAAKSTEAAQQAAFVEKVESETEKLLAKGAA